MTEDIADSLRFRNGPPPLQLAPLELAPFLDEVRERIGEPEQVERVTINVLQSVPPVLADADQLDRIVTNLLSNALKYSPGYAPVTIEISASGDVAQISVRDQGVGIGPEARARLFTPYYRAEGTETAAPGLGLGLYVTRTLVEAHGGQISVASTPGTGSVFTVTLRLAER